MQIPEVGSIFAYPAQQIKSLILKKRKKFSPKYGVLFNFLKFYIDLIIFIISTTPDDSKCP